MRNRPFPPVLIFPILMGAVLAFTAGCTVKAQETVNSTPALPVILGEIVPRRVESVLNQIGTLKARQEVMIRAEAEGVITQILFTEGKEVKKGDVLVQLDSTKIQSQIQNLTAKIEQLNVRLANKQKELERNKPLLKQNLVSSQQYDNLVAVINETQAEIGQAKADLALQQERLSDTTIRAPFDGITGARTIAVGDYIKSGDSLLPVLAMDPLEIQFLVPEKYIPAVQLGQTVQVMVDAYPERVFEGTIFFISPNVDTISRNIEIKAVLDNQERLLKPGMFARLSLVTDVRDNSLTVPTESIVIAEDETYIYVVDDQMTAHKVTVRLGQITREWTEILGTGLQPHTRVIVEGKYSAKEGVKVMESQKAEPPVEQP